MTNIMTYAISMFFKCVRVLCTQSPSLGSEGKIRAYTIACLEDSFQGIEIVMLYGPCACEPMLLPRIVLCIAYKCTIGTTLPRMALV